MEINEIFPMQCTLRKKARANVDLVEEVRKDLGLDGLDLVSDLGTLNVDQVKLNFETSPNPCSNILLGFEPWS